MISNDTIDSATKLVQIGKFDEAERILRESPDFSGDPAARQLLGVIGFQTNRIEDALGHFEKAAEGLPADGYLQNNLGLAYRALGKLEAATAAFEKAAELQPEFADPLNYLGLIYRNQENFDRAEESFISALKRRPKYGEAHFNLGALLQERDRLEEAREHYEQALKAKPDYIQAYNNLGTLLDDWGDPASAEENYLRGLEISPNSPELHTSLGSCLRLQGRYNEALEHYQQALEIASEFTDGRWNLGFLQLAMGEFQEGWENYLHRHGVDRNCFPMPADRLSSDLEGQKIELAAEQGLGDQIFFLRFAEELKRRGANVTVQPDPKLASLIERVEGIAVDSAGEHALTLADLPYLLDSNTALPSIDIPVPQMALDEMRSRLAEAGPAPYIAITYRAGGAGKDTLVKNAPLKEIGEALKDIKATLINVQRQPTNEEKAQLETSLGARIADFSDVNENLEDALALMSVLDDYIGVSNTNMHLRAAAGKSARVLVTHPGEYRWMVEGERSPWFPNFDLYRQDAGGGWERAFRKLSADIKTSHE